MGADTPKPILVPREMLTAEGRTIHLGSELESFAPYTLAVGDPKRAERVAYTMLLSVKRVADHRGNLAFTGSYMGTRVTVWTHQMGAAVAIDNLTDAVISGARVVVRCGSCGSNDPLYPPGTVVVWDESRYTGSPIEEYLLGLEPDELMGKAHPDVVESLLRFAPVKSPVTGITRDGFYYAQGRAGLHGPVPDELVEGYRTWRRDGIRAIEMEMGAIFLWMWSLRKRMGYTGLRWGGLSAIYAQRDEHGRGSYAPNGMDEALKAALDALAALARRDAARGHQHHPVQVIDRYPNAD